MLENLPLARAGVDRDAVTRASAEDLARLRGHPDARWLLARPDGVAATGAALDLHPMTALGDLGWRDLRPALDAGPDAGDPWTRVDARTGSADLADDAGNAGWVLGYLGTDRGVPYFVVLVTGESLPAPIDDVVRRATIVGLRDVGDLPDREAGLAVAAVALAAWHARHPRCPRCGAVTLPVQAAWSRECVADGSVHFPRTDPAVIMGVRDHDDRVLLGHAATFPAHRWSCLAGFVEAGESAEAAVRRETAEETAVAVGELEYLGSQPWPFPCSLMLAYLGRTVEPRPEPRPDGVEMLDARFFSRAELRAAVDSGEVVLPPGSSIARAILTHWYGAALPGD